MYTFVMCVLKCMYIYIFIYLYMHMLYIYTHAFIYIYIYIFIYAHFHGPIFVIIVPSRPILGCAKGLLVCSIRSSPDNGHMLPGIQTMFGLPMIAKSWQQTIKHHSSRIAYIFKIGWTNDTQWAHRGTYMWAWKEHTGTWTGVP